MVRPLSSACIIRSQMSYCTRCSQQKKTISANQKCLSPPIAEPPKCNISATVWDPLNVFRCPSDVQHAVIILNRPLYWKPGQIHQIWLKAKFTHTVDGGTDQWLEYLEDQAESVLNGQCKEFLPKLVTGDMDSISMVTLKRLKKIGAKVIHTPDQNETDFTKALRQLKLHTTKENIHLDAIYVFTENSGRLDHITANINTLYKSFNILGNIQIILVAHTSLTWLLRPGKHKILIPKPLIEADCWCSLIPFGTSDNRTTTSGLKWNLDNTCMKFGGLISTSNTYNGEPEVTIDANAPIVWSMGIEPTHKLVTETCKV